MAKATQEIKDFAEALFMQMATGKSSGQIKHKYSYRKISEEIEKEFKIKISHKAVSNWAGDTTIPGGISWRQRFSSAVASGVFNATVSESEQKQIDTSEEYQSLLTGKAEKEFQDLESLLKGNREILSIFNIIILKNLEKEGKKLPAKKIEDIEIKELFKIVPPSVLKSLIIQEKNASERVKSMRGNSPSGKQNKRMKEINEMTEEELCDGWDSDGDY